MANSYGPKGIVTDGIVFSMDAGNPQSFTSGSTEAYNLMGGQTGSLINSAQYNSDGSGCWEFDGTDDRIDCDTLTNIIGAGSYQSYSMECWVKSNANGNYYIVWGCKDTNFHAGGYALISRYGSGVGYYNSDGDWGDTRRYPKTANVTPHPVWSQVTVTYDGANVYIYLNGSKAESTGTTTETGDIGVPGEEFCIGGTLQPAWAEWNGWITAFKIYNKTLSDVEVLQNYNSQKARFGL
jgi:hypothetical protein